MKAKCKSCGRWFKSASALKVHKSLNGYGIKGMIKPPTKDKR